jgi:peptidoglycan/xylan/chitin deacetylase (PgdA/CDA1 family)
MTTSELTGLAGTAGCGAAFLAWAVRGRASSVFGPSVDHGPRDRNAIALTFDDGPSESTPRVLELLDKYQTPATFFQIGANVERLPAVARAVHTAGHEIGNHSHTHPLFCFHSAEFIYREFARAQRAIADATGCSPTLLRAPYGARWFGFREAQRRLGLHGVMWTAIGYDWKRKADTIVGRMLAGAANGAILCLHDGRKVRANPDIRETLAAVGRLIPALRDRGYEFDTVSRLLCPMN